MLILRIFGVRAADKGEPKASKMQGKLLSPTAQDPDEE